MATPHNSHNHGRRQVSLVTQQQQHLTANPRNHADSSAIQVEAQRRTCLAAVVVSLEELWVVTTTRKTNLGRCLEVGQRTVPPLAELDSSAARPTHNNSPPCLAGISRRPQPSRAVCSPTRHNLNHLSSSQYNTMPESRTRPLVDLAWARVRHPRTQSARPM